MCSRYYADDTTGQKIRELTGNDSCHIKTGDIRPSETATILSGKGPDMIAEDMVWGFPGRDGKGLLINARAETVKERPAFKESVLSRRCVIPAKGFYEWSLGKDKYQFEEPGQTLFMAGFFDIQHRFVIITTAANESVLPVHERMPLLLYEEEIVRWIKETDYMNTVLHKVPQTLKRWTQYQQMSLFDRS